MLLTGCERPLKTVSNVGASTEVPKHLQQCKVVNIDFNDGYERSMFVLDCGVGVNTNVSYQSGKVMEHTSVVYHTEEPNQEQPTVEDIGCDVNFVPAPTETNTFLVSSSCPPSTTTSIYQDVIYVNGIKYGKIK